ncbi:MAG: type II toxin-antitoxin system VapC family toxin [Firmicutes bacterium]|nr:type II toxin-antitoxin system VapC family toxin [Bacillota bacterium]
MVYMWIDANVILRFITGDPPEMAEKVLELMPRIENGEMALRLSHIVVAEVVWVLSSFYKYSKKEIAETMITFINADGIYPDNPTLLIQALKDMDDYNVDFADAYLAALARTHLEAVCSFDNDFKKLNVNLVLPPGMET